MEKYIINQQTNKTFGKKKTVLVIIILLVLFGVAYYWQTHKNQETTKRGVVHNPAEGYSYTKLQELEASFALNDKILIPKITKNSVLDPSLLPDPLKYFVINSATSTKSFSVTYNPKGSGYVLFYSTKEREEKVLDYLIKNIPAGWATLSSQSEPYIGSFEVENKAYQVKTRVIYEQGGAMIKVFVIKK